MGVSRPLIQVIRALESITAVVGVLPIVGDDVKNFLDLAIKICRSVEVRVS
jgi:hypothetical protein